MDIDARNLTARERLQQKLIKERDAEIRRLKAALNALLSGGRAEDDEDEDMEDEGEDADEDEDCGELPEGISDDEYQIYRCTDCAWEIVNGFCSQCGKEHICPDDDEEEYLIGIVHTNDNVVNSDRRLAPRASTPLLEVAYQSPMAAPPEYRRGNTPGNLSLDRVPEYNDLLRRGATKLMCETYHLEYKHDRGIIAWADPDLFEDFAGPKMQAGDFWKICLGRRIVLHPDDADGSMFIEELLDEVLYYPVRPDFSEHVEERWETVEETPGIWITRPLVAQAPPDPDDRESSVESSETTDDEGERVRELQDEALDPENGAKGEETAIRPDEYEGTDVDDEEESEEMDNGMGALWYRMVGSTADIAYDSEEDEEYADHDIGTVVKLEDGSEVIDLVMRDDSEPGSDWDSDEELSGDEAAMELAHAWLRDPKAFLPCRRLY